MTLDDQRLRELCEESQDLQSDAIRTSKEALDEYVGVSRENPQDDDPAVASERVDRQSRAGRLTTAALVAGGFTAAAGVLFEGVAAAAASSGDVAILQTAASIEVLAVATYTKALTLPFIGGTASQANQVVKAFATTTKAQHAAHLAAFNGAIKAMGGKEQNSADPKYASVVTKAVPTLTTPLKVVDLARTLELVAAETYVNDCSQLSSQSARTVMASIMGIEAQHVATLDAVKALLTANAPQLIALSPTNVASLPAVAGKVGIPYPFWPTSMASPASEGAVS